MLLFDVAPFNDRNHFGDFLNAKGLLGRAVEIGTHRAEWAERFLSTWRGQYLYCIDPWQRGYDPMDPASAGDREQDMAHARQVLEPLYKHRSQLYRLTSEQAVGSFSDGSLDFAYIDGCHQPESVRHDLTQWWRKVKVAGLLGGHDFICPNEISGGWGQFVQPEVLRFASEKRATVYLVAEADGRPWSYYMEKTSDV